MSIIMKAFGIPIKIIKSLVWSPDGDTTNVHINAGILQGDWMYAF